MDEALKTILDTGLPKAQLCLSTILKVLENIIAQPEEPKFRRLRTSNGAICTKIVEIDGGVALLVALGFEQPPDELVLPTAPAEEQLPLLTTAREVISALLDEACEAEGAAFTLSAAYPHVHGARSCCGLEGETLVSGAMDNLIRIWRRGDAEPCFILEGHEGVKGTNGVLALRCSSAGQLVSAGRDGKINVWAVPPPGEAGAPTLATTLLGHGDEQAAKVSNAQVVSALAEDADGRLVSAGWDQTVRVWPGGSGAAEVIGANGALASPVTAVAVLADGTLAAGYGDGTVRLPADTNTDAARAAGLRGESEVISSRDRPETASRLLRGDEAALRDEVPDGFERQIRSRRLI